MYIVTITTVAQNVQHLLAEDAHATRQLHCQWRSGPFHAKCAVYLKWFLTSWTPVINRQNYKDGKFKVSWRLYLPITVKTQLVHVIFFVCIFFQICDKFETLIFQRHHTLLWCGGKGNSALISFWKFLSLSSGDKIWKSVKIWRS